MLEKVIRYLVVVVIIGGAIWLAKTIRDVIIKTIAIRKFKEMYKDEINEMIKHYEKEYEKGN